MKTVKFPICLKHRNEKGPRRVIVLDNNDNLIVVWYDEKTRIKIMPLVTKWLETFRSEYRQISMDQCGIPLEELALLI